MNSRRPSRLLAIVPAILAVAGSSAPAAEAAPPPPMTVAVHPRTGPLASYFQLAGQRGRTLSGGTIELRNRGSRRISVMLDSVGALTATTLGSAYNLRGGHANGAAGWTELPRRVVVLGPHASANIPVRVRVPHGAKPGDYLSGISVQARDQRPQLRVRGNLAVASVQRYVIGVLVRLPGARHPQIRLTGASVDRKPAGLTFSLAARNPGNAVLQNVHGTILITDGRRVVARRPLGPGTFVDGTAIAYPIPVPREQPREGTVYRVRASMHYGPRVALLDTRVRFGRASAERQQEFGGPAVPHRTESAALSTLVAAAAFALFAVVALLLWLRRRRALGARAAVRKVERAMAYATRTGDPLSVISVVCRSDRSAARSLAALARRHARRSDRVWPLRSGGALVIAADTPVEAARVVGGEIERHMPGNDAAVNVVAWDGEAPAPELLAAATALPPPESAPGDAVRAEHEGAGLDLDEPVIRPPDHDRERI